MPDGLLLVIIEVRLIVYLTQAQLLVIGVGMLHLIIPHTYLLFQRHVATDSSVFIARAGGLLLMVDCIHSQLFLVNHVYLAVALRLRQTARLESHVIRLN